MNVIRDFTFSLENIQNVTIIDLNLLVFQTIEMIVKQFQWIESLVQHPRFAIQWLKKSDMRYFRINLRVFQKH